MYLQRLYESFKENQYPGRATKESLAQEVGLTFQQVITFGIALKVNAFLDFSCDFLNFSFFLLIQVNKWFDNTRWSFRHSSHKETSAGQNASEQATDSRAENEGALGGEKRDCELVSQEGSGEKSKTPSPRKRKHMSEPQASEATQGVDSAAHEKHTGHKMKTRQRQ